MIAICCALECEAKSLIKAFSLKKKEGKYPVYTNTSIILIVTGTQKNAAIAIGYLFGIERNISLLLNAGICGHKDLDIGTVVFNHKIRYQDKSIYPLPYLDKVHKPLQTVEEVETKYKKDSCYDMEGFFVFSAASKWICFDHMISIKVVSDNLLNPPKKDKSFISSLLELSIEPLKKILGKTEISLDNKELLSRSEYILLEKKIKTLAVLSDKTKAKKILFSTLDREITELRKQ